MLQNLPVGGQFEERGKKKSDCPPCHPAALPKYGPAAGRCVFFANARIYIRNEKIDSRSNANTRYAAIARFTAMRPSGTCVQQADERRNTLFYALAKG